MDKTVEKVLGSVHGVGCGLVVSLGKEVGNGISLLGFCNGGNHVDPLNGIAL